MLGDCEEGIMYDVGETDVPASGHTIHTLMSTVKVIPPMKKSKIDTAQASQKLVICDDTTTCGLKIMFTVILI